MTVEYMDQSGAVHILQVLVILVSKCNVVLGVPRWLTRNPEIDWATVPLSSLRTACAEREVQWPGKIVQYYDGKNGEYTNVQLQKSGGSTVTLHSKL